MKTQKPSAIPMPVENEAAPDIDPRLVGMGVAPIIPLEEKLAPEKALSIGSQIVSILQMIWGLIERATGNNGVLLYSRQTILAGQKHTFRADIQVNRWVVWSELTATATDLIAVRLGEDAGPNDLTIRAGKRVTLPANQRLVTVCNCSPTNSVTVQCVAVSGGPFEVGEVY